MTDVAERRKRSQDKSGGWLETVRTVGWAVLIALAVRTFAVEPFNIPSGSMIPTLLVGDYLFVSKFSYGYSRYSLPFGPPLFPGRIFFREPERGDGLRAECGDGLEWSGQCGDHAEGGDGDADGRGWQDAPDRDLEVPLEVRARHGVADRYGTRRRKELRPARRGRAGARRLVFRRVGRR